jgi:hypothetical protein
MPTTPAVDFLVAQLELALARGICGFSPAADEISRALGELCAKHDLVPNYPTTPIRLHYDELLSQYAITHQTITVHPKQYAVVLRPSEGTKGIWVVTFDSTAEIADHIDICKLSIDDVIKVVDLQSNTVMSIRNRVYIG